MTTHTATAAHQLPNACHVCGSPAARNLECSECGQTGAPCHRARPTCSHNYTNAEALAAATAHDARTTVVYASGARTAEAAYVDGTRGR